MAGGRKSRKDSQVRKAKIVKLKKRGASGNEIASELGVSKQYVSQVLIEAGLAYGVRPRVRKKPEGFREEVIATIARLERGGEPGLAEMLRGMINR